MKKNRDRRLQQEHRHDDDQHGAREKPARHLSAQPKREAAPCLPRTRGNVCKANVTGEAIRMLVRTRAGSRRRRGEEVQGASGSGSTLRRRRAICTSTVRSPAASVAKASRETARPSASARTRRMSRSRSVSRTGCSPSRNSPRARWNRYDPKDTASTVVGLGVGRVRRRIDRMRKSSSCGSNGLPR